MHVYIRGGGGGGGMSNTFDVIAHGDHYGASIKAIAHLSRTHNQFFNPCTQIGQFSL